MHITLQTRLTPSTLLTAIYCIFGVSAALSSPVWANADDASFVVSDAWIRAMPPGQPMTAAYLQLRNDGEDVVVIDGVRSPVGDASLHETILVDGVSRMRAVPVLTLMPGESVSLAPGGMHIMLMGVATQPAPGTEVPLCLLSAGSEFCALARVQRKVPAKGVAK